MQNLNQNTFIKTLVFAASLLVIALLSEKSAASLKDDVKSAFHDMTSMRSSNRAGVYKSQTAMHYSGGSYMERYPVREYQLFTARAPSFSAGCGGIDLDFGGFSHINSDEIKQMLANIAANSKGLVYKLGIDIVSAQLGGVMEYMERVAAFANSQNINSCEAAEALVDAGVEAIKTTGSLAACVAKKVKDGSADGYIAATKACRAGSQPDATKVDKLDEGKVEDMGMLGNLVWRAMARRDMFGSNGKSHSGQTLRYLVMNMTGTVVKMTEDPKWKDWFTSNPPEGAVTRVTAPMAGQGLGDTVNTLMYGGEVELLKCMKLPEPSNDWKTHVYGCAGVEGRGDNKILATISKSDAFYGQVDAALKKLIDNMKADTPLDESQEHLLSSTSLPVWSLLASAVAAGGTDLAHGYRGYLSEIIAREYLHNYLGGMLDEVKATIVEQGGADNESKWHVIRGIDDVLEGLRNLKQKHENSQDHVYKLLAQHEMYKKVVVSRIPSSLGPQVKGY